MFPLPAFTASEPLCQTKRDKNVYWGATGKQNQLPHKGNAVFKAAGNHPLHSEQMNTEVDGKEMPV